MLTVIYEAAGCLPPELCRLIDDFRERPHSWTTAGTVRLTTNEVDPTTTEIVGSGAEFFQTLVSSASFATGHLQFSAEFTVRTDVGSSWIGVGVSRSVTNRGSDPYRRKLPELASIDDWIVAPINNIRSLVVHNGDLQFLHLTSTSSDYSNRRPFRIDISADPVGGNITATVLQVVGGVFRTFDKPILLLTASTTQHALDGMPDLASLRPCIVVADVGDDGRPIVFRSGSE